LKWNQDCQREKKRYLLADSVWKCKEVFLTTKRGESTLFNRRQIRFKMNHQSQHQKITQNILMNQQACFYATISHICFFWPCWWLC